MSGKAHIRVKLKEPRSKEAEEEKMRIERERRRAYRARKLEALSFEERSEYWKGEVLEQLNIGKGIGKVRMGKTLIYKKKGSGRG